MRAEDFDAMIERMALAICNVIRERAGFGPLSSMVNVADADYYRAQARAAYAAQDQRQ